MTNDIRVRVALGGAIVIATAVVVAAKVSQKRPAPESGNAGIISTLVTNGPAQDAPADGATHPVYAGGFCEALERESHAATVKGSKLAGRVLDPIVPKPRCVDGKRGGWGFRVEDAIGVDTDVSPGQTDIGFHVVLVHRDADGMAAVHALPHDVFGGDGGPTLDVEVTLTTYWGSRSIDSLVVGNIDGDGDPEVLVAGSVNEEGPNPGWSELLTFKDGTIRPYEPAKDIEVGGADDVDHDGLLDVLTPGSYAGVEAWSAIGSSYPAIGAIFVAHALPDGGFSMTDAVAKAHLLETCPKKTPIALAPSEWIEPTDASQQILCARAWGASEADVIKQLAARCARYTPEPHDMTECPSVLRDAAKIDPVVRLP